MPDDPGTGERRAINAAGATPLMNSVSPTGFMASGPVAKYIAWHCMKTVAMILCPVPVSSSNSGNR
jgi:hypothetical protein